ncbi:MAG: glutathione S-transferase family protein [Acetobacteraceae bacterium]
MKLHWSPRSPFVRKVVIVAYETGLHSRIRLVRTPVSAIEPNRTLMGENPLSKIPTLVADDGTPIYDSRVICEYLDTLHAGPPLFPKAPAEGLTALRWQALGDGMLDFLVLWLGERNRASELQSAPHLAAWQAKLAACLETLEKQAADLHSTRFGIGQIAIGTALCYLDFRFASELWRTHAPALAAWHAGFAARPSVRATVPVDDTADPISPPPDLALPVP